MTQISPAQRLRDLLGQGRIVIAPGAYDAWSAVLVEKAGFPAVYMTGFGTAASRLGAPDLGLLTQTEMVDQATRVAGAISVPLIADADTGFGGFLNVQRTIRLYARAGVAALHIEDQVLPKRCGHMENKEIVELPVMLERLVAAREACEDDERPLLIARTDARAVHGLDDALRRAEAYLRAGADMLFIEAPQSEAEMRRICETFPDVLLLANMAEGGKTPYHDAETLAAIGFSLVIFPIATLLVATAAVSAALEELREHGRLVGKMPSLDFGGFNTLMGLERYLEAQAALKRKLES